MKKHFLFATLILSGSLFISCGNSNKSTEEGETEDTGIIEKISGTADAVKGLSALEETMKDIQAQTDALKTKTPLSNDELKKILPEELDGLKRKSIRLGESASLGVSSADASYSNEDKSKTIDISIMDGAGESASSIAALAFMGYNVDSEEINENRTEKTTDFKGQRAKLTESQDHGEQNAKIEWIQKKRYLMKLEGKGYSIDQLGSVMENLALGGLKE